MHVLQQQQQTQTQQLSNIREDKYLVDTRKISSKFIMLSEKEKEVAVKRNSHRLASLGSISEK